MPDRLLGRVAPTGVLKPAKTLPMPTLCFPPEFQSCNKVRHTLKYTVVLSTFLELWPRKYPTYRHVPYIQGVHGETIASISDSCCQKLFCLLMSNPSGSSRTTAATADTSEPPRALRRSERLSALSPATLQLPSHTVVPSTTTSATESPASPPGVTINASPDGTVSASVSGTLLKRAIVALFVLGVVNTVANASKL